jgi:hypothetical protein
MQTLHDAGRYPSGGVVPEVARGMAAYARGALEEAVDILVPQMPQLERTGGSRAQEDLIEFTVYKAHIQLSRMTRDCIAPAVAWHREQAKPCGLCESSVSAERDETFRRQGARVGENDSWRRPVEQCDCLLSVRHVVFTQST